MDNNQYTPQNPQAFFKIIAIIHGALLLGQVLFGIAAFLITKTTYFDIKPGNDPFFYVVPLLAATGILIGSFLYKQQLTKLAGKGSLMEKKAGYQTALIIRCALAEGPSLLGIVAFIDTGNLFYLYLSGFILLYFLWLRPTKEKMGNDMDLSYEDKIELGG